LVFHIVAMRPFRADSATCRINDASAELRHGHVWRPAADNITFGQ
jgi:hypothetical protein